MNAKEELQICLHEIKYRNIINIELEKLFVEMLDLQDKNLIFTSRYKKLNELIEKNEKLIEASEIKVNKIKNKISQMKQPYKNILLLRYINGKSYEDIAIESNYSIARIFQLHRKALNFYDQKYFINENNLNLDSDRTL